MTDHAELEIRPLNGGDPELIAREFLRIGWRKPASLFERYLAEQTARTRSCWLANWSTMFAGYVTVNWEPAYPFFAEHGIPEIQDLNVLPDFRRRGIGAALLEHAEAQISFRSEVAGIGVGLHPGYNAAQRLYGKLGYIPDGRGVTYKDCYLREGEWVLLDDDLVLHLTRRLRPRS